MNPEENRTEESLDAADAAPERDEQISDGRRDAVTKLAYASPLVAGLLFSKRAAAFSPPPPPDG